MIRALSPQIKKNSPELKKNQTHANLRWALKPSTSDQTPFEVRPDDDMSLIFQNLAHQS